MLLRQSFYGAHQHHALRVAQDSAKCLLPLTVGEQQGAIGAKLVHYHLHLLVGHTHLHSCHSGKHHHGSHNRCEQAIYLTTS